MYPVFERETTPEMTRSVLSLPPADVGSPKVGRTVPERPDDPPKQYSALRGNSKTTLFLKQARGTHIKEKRIRCKRAESQLSDRHIPGLELIPSFKDYQSAR